MCKWSQIDEIKAPDSFDVFLFLILTLNVGFEDLNLSSPVLEPDNNSSIDTVL